MPGGQVKMPGKTSGRVKPHSAETFNNIFTHTARTPAVALCDELIAEAGRYMGPSRSKLSSDDEQT